ncbi:MAG: polysaccharide biosynthesis C-terminal domain-containing protein, partial [Lachnospiraceae bacterium]|nr:polysaccharide biosynthesis C-terminal domain-containing protein [Lachnospiraceae bacterium]
TLTSILHGLGKPTTTFLLNLLSSGIRILGIYAFIPMFGIRSYLMAMLLSQLFLAGSATFLLVRFCKKSRHAMVLSP